MGDSSRENQGQAGPNEVSPVKLIAVILGGGGVAVYLLLVFMTALEIGKGGHYDLAAKPGWSLPSGSAICGDVLKRYGMTPYADSNPPHQMHQFPEYRERGNVWLLDSARTVVYETAILDHPECLQYVLQQLAAMKQREVLVIYDRGKKTEVLTARNY